MPVAIDRSLPDYLVSLYCFSPCLMPARSNQHLASSLVCSLSRSARLAATERAACAGWLRRAWAGCTGGSAEPAEPCFASSLGWLAGWAAD